MLATLTLLAQVISSQAFPPPAPQVDAILHDTHGHNAEVNVMGDLRVGIPHRLVGTAFFSTTLDTLFWSSSYSGANAAITQATDDLTLASGTANNGYATISSARVARFVFAHPHVWRGAIRAAATAASNTRYWGAFNHTNGVPQDGFYFKFGTGLSVCRAVSASETCVASGSFNQLAGAYTLDTNLHAYEIHYFMMHVEFIIDDVVIHDFAPTTANLSGTFNLAASAVSLNGAGGTTSGVLDVHAMTILRLGKEATQPRSQYQSGQVAALVLKRGAGILHQLAVSGVAVNSVITLYDAAAATGGTEIWSSGSMGANTTPFVIDLHEVPFYTGLTLAITTANSTVTVIYE